MPGREGTRQRPRVLLYCTSFSGLNKHFFNTVYWILRHLWGTYPQIFTWVHRGNKADALPAQSLWPQGGTQQQTQETQTVRPVTGPGETAGCWRLRLNTRDTVRAPFESLPFLPSAAALGGACSLTLTETHRTARPWKSPTGSVQAGVSRRLHTLCAPHSRPLSGHLPPGPRRPPAARFCPCRSAGSGTSLRCRPQPLRLAASA